MISSKFIRGAKMALIRRDEYYSGKLDKINRDDCIIPSGSRFILTEAALACQLFQLLDKSVKIDNRTGLKHVEKPNQYTPSRHEIQSTT